MKPFVLSEKQRRVLACAQFQAQASVPQIAKETALKSTTVRYTLRELRDRGIIGYMPFIDISRIGLMDYCIYFNSKFKSENERKKLLSYLSAAEPVTWVAELAGEYQYTAALYVKSVREVDEFVNRVSEETGAEITEKNFAARVKWSLFRSKYLAPDQNATIDELTAGDRPGDVKLDPVDHKILILLSSNEEESPSAIARRLGLPISTIHYRLRSLETQGVIKGYSYRFNAIECGNYKFRVLLYQKKGSPNLAGKLHAFCRRHPNVNCYVHCVGSWDYELSVEVEHLHEIALIEQIIMQNFGDHITSIKVLTVLRHVKTCLYPYRFPR